MEMLKTCHRFPLYHHQRFTTLVPASVQDSAVLEVAYQQPPTAIALEERKKNIKEKACF
jgi:hypothetical protein